MEQCGAPWLGVLESHVHRDADLECSVQPHQLSQSPRHVNKSRGQTQFGHMGALVSDHVARSGIEFQCFRPSHQLSGLIVRRLDPANVECVHRTEVCHRQRSDRTPQGCEVLKDSSKKPTLGLVLDNLIVRSAHTGLPLTQRPGR